jgi:hypothetical protein
LDSQFETLALGDPAGDRQTKARARRLTGRAAIEAIENPAPFDRSRTALLLM